MPDKFETMATGMTGPASEVFEIVPDDGADLAQATRAINVATSGYVRVTTTAGTDGTVYVAAGIAFPIRATRVWASGTDATGIVGML
jgi:hypothetical protein